MFGFLIAMIKGTFDRIKKAEIANNLNYEQLQMQNDNAIMETLNDLVVRENRLELSTKARENIKTVTDYVTFN